MLPQYFDLIHTHPAQNSIGPSIYVTVYLNKDLNLGLSLRCCLWAYAVQFSAAALKISICLYLCVCQCVCGSIKGICGGSIRRSAANLLLLVPIIFISFCPFTRLQYASCVRACVCERNGKSAAPPPWHAKMQLGRSSDRETKSELGS